MAWKGQERYGHEADGKHRAFAAISVTPRIARLNTSAYAFERVCCLDRIQRCPFFRPEEGTSKPQYNPCANIASATFTNPAIFAPST